MKITLSQSEIEQAIFAQMGTIFTDVKKMKCEFTSTRGPAGIVAEIEADFGAPFASAISLKTEPEQDEAPISNAPFDEALVPEKESTEVHSLFGNLK